MNLVCAAVVFNLFLKSRIHNIARISPSQHINKYYIFRKMKLALVFFYTVFFLLKQKKDIFYLVKSINKRIVTKKYFYKIFSGKFFFNSELFLTKVFFNYYCTFYKNLMKFDELFPLTKYNFELLKMINLKFHNLYNKFVFIHSQKFGAGKDLVNKYCRCILNFRGKRRIIFLSAIKKCLLFLKKNICIHINIVFLFMQMSLV